MLQHLTHKLGVKGTVLLFPCLAKALLSNTATYSFYLWPTPVLQGPWRPYFMLEIQSEEDRR
jgi:hypothetical protein